MVVKKIKTAMESHGMDASMLKEYLLPSSVDSEVFCRCTTCDIKEKIKICNAARRSEFSGMFVVQKRDHQCIQNRTPDTIAGTFAGSAYPF